MCVVRKSERLEYNKEGRASEREDSLQCFDTELSFSISVPVGVRFQEANETVATAAIMVLFPHLLPRRKCQLEMTFYNFTQK